MDQNSPLSSPNVRKQHKAFDPGQVSWGSREGVDGYCHFVGLNKVRLGAGRKQIDCITGAHAQPQVMNTHGTSRNVEKDHVNQKTVPCVYFYKGSCLQKQSHETSGSFYKHFCSHFLQKEGKSFSHTQLEFKKNLSKTQASR